MTGGWCRAKKSKDADAFLAVSCVCNWRQNHVSSAYDVFKCVAYE